jgi:hypothetical protein
MRINLSSAPAKAHGEDGQKEKGGVKSRNNTTSNKERIQNKNFYIYKFTRRNET